MDAPLANEMGALQQGLRDLEQQIMKIASELAEDDGAASVATRRRASVISVLEQREKSRRA